MIDSTVTADLVQRTPVGGAGDRNSLRPSASARLSPFEQQVITIFSEISQALSLPKPYVEIYALLYASPGAVAFAEIESKLGHTKDTISQGLRMLRDFGAIRMASSEGDLRERYLPETELRKVVGALLRQRLEPQLRAGATGVQALPRLLAASSELSAADRATLASRITKLSSWRRRAAMALSVLRRFVG